MSRSNVERETRTASLLEGFRSLNPEFSPVPFYWWSGESLTRERIAWQLDQLREKGIRQTLISYPHDKKNKTVAGDPPIFSQDWWNLLRWFLGACRQRGMTTGIQDYTLVGPILQAIGLATPDMEGGQMSSVAQNISGGEARLVAESGSLAIGAWAYPVNKGIPQAPDAIDLTKFIHGESLAWTAPKGEWFVALVFVRRNPFDPLHPESGRLAIEQLYAPFERECPEEIGTALKIFFQDELDFGSRMPFWSNCLLQAFAKEKGYDLCPWLPALWHDLGTRTEKVRLDYYDVCVSCMEDSYFKPIYKWHEAHGTIFGNDNCGRGEIAVGRQYYGDYFRTMRWYSAPGSDDPSIEKPRAFKGIKINSSIAHLYQRPRVWNEAFHSSGWGVTPADVVAALGEDFVCGATVVNLHGLYYSTYGGWWEWASPDFHFRQPYWKNCLSLNHYLARLCRLLSQGVHRCDVAILYPTAALDVEPADAINPGWDNYVPQRWENDFPKAEDAAFDLGKYLFDRACDFDFIDFESLQRAQFSRGRLEVSLESYQVLILPAAKAVHFSTLEKALDFIRSGGVVIAYGCLPKASDRSGRDDPKLQDLVEEIFGVVQTSPQTLRVKDHASGGRGIYTQKDLAEVLEMLNKSISRDVVSSIGPIQVLHRCIDDHDLFFVFNPATVAVDCNITFRAIGAVKELNAWTGADIEIAPIVQDENSTTLRLVFSAREGRLLMFDNSDQAAGNTADAPAEPNNALIEILRLDDQWEFSLEPTLDNRFGDFRLPSSNDFIGPEARRFRWADEMEPQPDWHTDAFDDSQWPEATCSFGLRALSLGPLPTGTDFAALESQLVRGTEKNCDWVPYEFSLRWGIERDPYLLNRMSGPHGLKNSIPDEFFDFYDATPGTVWYLRTQVTARQDGVVPFIMGARCIFRAWVSGQLVLEQPDTLPPGFHAPWGLPHYDSEPRETRVFLHRGVNDLLVKLVQPEGQRTRAFVAFQLPNREEGILSLPWFTDPSSPRLSYSAPSARRAVWARFPAPPGMFEMEFVARGPVRVWANETEFGVSLLGKLPDGSFHYRATGTEASARAVTAAIRVEASLESRGGDVLPEPIRFTCGPGRMTLGDWSAQGLAVYSGIGRYQTSFQLPELLPGQKLILELGEVAATAEIIVNSRRAAELVTPPWQIEITDFVHHGLNQITIAVANTLANHYSVGIPSPYAVQSQTRSGLFGPVRLLLKNCNLT